MLQLFPGGGGAEAERGLLLRGHRHHDAGLLRRPLRLGHLRGVQLAQHRTLGEIARRYALVQKRHLTTKLIWS